jgi:hypothetical protein
MNVMNVAGHTGTAFFMNTALLSTFPAGRLFFAQNIFGASSHPMTLGQVEVDWRTDFEKTISYG